MLAQVHELVHGFQHTEQNECQNDKVNDGRDECTDAQVDVKRQVQHNITEICLEQNANDGVDDVVRQRSDQRGECAADENTDGHVHHVAFQGKSFELFQELFHNVFPPVWINFQGHAPHRLQTANNTPFCPAVIAAA